MLPRIRAVKVLPDFFLQIVFDDGRAVLYDVKEDMEQIESYRELRTIHALFDQVRLAKAEPACSGTIGLIYPVIPSANMTACRNKRRHCGGSWIATGADEKILRIAPTGAIRICCY